MRLYNDSCIFLSQNVNKYSKRLEIGTELHLALEWKEFFLVYQPRFDLKTNAMVGMEVLLRWQYPQRGVVFPDEFIFIAEKFGLIIPIGEWVLRTACREYVYWKNKYATFNCTLTINISLHQFKHQGFIPSIKKMLYEYNIPPHLLELEITKATIADLLVKIEDSLIRLRDMGVKLSFDNFGAGYLPLAHLKNSPVQSIKLKQSIIEDDNFKKR